VHFDSRRFDEGGVDPTAEQPARLSLRRIDTAFVDRLLSKCHDHLSAGAPATLDRVYDFGRRGVRRDLRHAAHHDAPASSSTSAPVVRLDEARADRRRRYPDRRGTDLASPAAHQESVRPVEGFATNDRRRSTA